MDKTKKTLLTEKSQNAQDYLKRAIRYNSVVVDKSHESEIELNDNFLERMQDNFLNRIQQMNLDFDNTLKRPAEAIGRWSILM